MIVRDWYEGINRSRPKIEAARDAVQGRMEEAPGTEGGRRDA
jgi:hypothetical protein